MAKLATILLFVALASQTNLSVGASPIDIRTTTSEPADRWRVYMAKAMGRTKEIFDVTAQPEEFGSLAEANDLSPKHAGINLVIAHHKWALAVGSTVYAFASDEFNHTISSAVAAGSVVGAKRNAPRGDVSPVTKRDHPFSWFRPDCTPGYPCDGYDDDDCLPYNCSTCVVEVDVPNPRMYCKHNAY